MHLLKIDTQGHELGVLRGAQRLFEEARINMVELEFWPKGMTAGGANGRRGDDCASSKSVGKPY